MISSALLLAAQAQAQDSLIAGLLGYWKLESSSRSEVSGSVGIESNCTFGSGFIGNGLISNGLNSSINTLVVPPMGASPRSISAWFKLRVATTLRHIWGYGNPANEEALNLTIWTSGEVGILTHASVQTYGTTLALGAWNHMLVTYDGTQIQLTYNGMDQPPWVHALNTQPSVQFAIAAGSYAPYNSPDATVDEVGVWDRKLTPAERSRVWNAGAGRTHPFS